MPSTKEIKQNNMLEIEKNKINKTFDKIVSFLIPIQILLVGPTLMGGFGVPNLLLLIILIIGLINTVLSVIKVITEGKLVGIGSIVIGIFSLFSFVLSFYIVINGGFH